MILHYLKITLRSLKKRPLLSGLNVFGLSVGLACFLVIMLYLFQEENYEKGIADYERVYRLEGHYLGMGRIAWTPANLSHKLEEVPEIEHHTLLQRHYSKEVKVDEVKHRLAGAFTADDGFFKVFDMDFLIGDKSVALDGPDKAVLTESAAMRLFQRTDVMGETIAWNDTTELIVTGVLKQDILKTHMTFDLIRSMGEPEAYSAPSWWNTGMYTYAKTYKQEPVAQLNTRLDSIASRYAFPVLYPQQDIGFEEWITTDNIVRFFAKPIRDIYLESDLQFELSANGDRQTRVTLRVIALFILTIAAINFMNLTTAKSSQRTKEIGVRKVLGTLKQHLVSQFLLESIFITLVATVIGAGLSELFIVLINDAYGEMISVSLLNYPILLVYVMIGVVLLGVLAGMYPAFYLSSVKMVPLLKGMRLGSVLNLGAAKLLRNGLVVVQFTISSTLIIASLFIYQQLKFLKDIDVGFDQDQVMIINNSGKLGANRNAFREEALKLPGIEQGSYGFRLPADGASSSLSVMLNKEESVLFEQFQVDPYYHETLGLTLKEGEWLSDQGAGLDSLVVLNEAAIKALQIEEPIGKVFGNYWRIVGVVEDFYYGDFKQEIQPVAFVHMPEHFRQLALRVEAGTNPKARVEALWSSFSDEPFDAHYLDHNYEQILSKEQQSADAVLIFTTLAIFISCLGLFGLSAFTADQRLHEFGIRKVLGAGVGDIVRIFSFDFVRLILLAFVIAVPLSIYGMNLWLQEFVQQISLSVWVFFVACIAALGVAFGTILFQSLKAGRLNPVDTIRNE